MDDTLHLLSHQVKYLAALFPAQEPLIGLRFVKDGQRKIERVVFSESAQQVIVRAPKAPEAQDGCRIFRSHPR